MDYDLVVIGGGTGGLSAGREAARRGASVLLVQQGRLGGDCTFTGCVPSKALLSAAARGEGFSDAMAGVQRAVETIAATEDDDALKRQGVEVLHGWATFRSPREIDVDGRPVRSPRFVVATGVGPAVPPIEGLRELRHLTNENLFELDRRPARLAVLGGGAIGAEGRHHRTKLVSIGEGHRSDERLTYSRSDSDPGETGDGAAIAEETDRGRRPREQLVPNPDERDDLTSR